ncbi:MAG: N-acetylglucosamine-6-phosphate deacetylase, partial [Chloroflexota bacterium]
MTRTLIENAKIITATTPLERGWLLVEDTKISAMGSGNAPSFDNTTRIDANGLKLMPGFIDVHVHGGVGHETMDATPDAIREMATFYARHGVTCYLPTTGTVSRDNILITLEIVSEMQGAQPNGATILGLHLEGPYLDMAKRGAQLESQVRRAEREEALAFLDMDIIKLLALAPEYEENGWLIEECRQRGVTVSAAHTSATHDQMQEAINQGITHATHTFNAMVGIHHREPGGVGALLTRPEVYCELIADTIHVHPTVMQILYACKGADRVVLITDAVRVAGFADGEYQKDDNRRVVVKDGAVRLPDGTLSGSTLTMDRALRNFMQATGEPLEKIWQTSSLNAARTLNMSSQKGSLEVGKDADLILVDSEITVHLTMAEGRIVYQPE